MDRFITHKSITMTMYSGYSLRYIYMYRIYIKFQYLLYPPALTVKPLKIISLLLLAARYTWQRPDCTMI